MIDDFLRWLIPSRTKETDYRKIATALMAEFGKMEETLDAYGEGPGETGGAYVIPGTWVEKIAEFLISKGYKRKKNKLASGNILVELGADTDSTYIYVSDDNEEKKEYAS